MSKALTRAFTTRRKNGEHKSRLSIGKDVPDLRAKISGPLHLVHTTNMLSYNAPDIPRSAATVKSSGSSLRSDDGSDGARTAASSPPTSPDVALDDCSSPEPEQNRLSTYFVAPSTTAPVVPRPSTSSRPSTANRPPSRPSTAQKQDSPPPPAPRRAPSHTSRSSQDAVARSRSISDRSVSDVSSKAFSHVSSASTWTSSSEPRSPLDYRLANPSFRPDYSRQDHSKPEYSKPKPSRAAMPPPPRTQPFSSSTATSPPIDLSTHPFGLELAQVSELAEEFGVKDRLMAIDEEEREMTRKGLSKLPAATYLEDIDGLFGKYFGTAHVATSTWI